MEINNPQQMVPVAPARPLPEQVGVAEQQAPVAANQPPPEQQAAVAAILPAPEQEAIAAVLVPLVDVPDGLPQLRCACKLSGCEYGVCRCHKAGLGCDRGVCKCMHRRNPHGRRL